jgi:hypothetical protein
MENLKCSNPTIFIDKLKISCGQLKSSLISLDIYKKFKFSEFYTLTKKEKIMKKSFLIALFCISIVTSGYAKDDRDRSKDRDSDKKDTAANDQNSQSQDRESSRFDQFIEKVVENAAHNPDFGNDFGVRN